jgi:hypothetical protein
VTQQEAAAYFDAVFNNNLSMAEQDESIIQFYRNAAMPNPSISPDQTIKLNRMDEQCQKS